MRTLSCQFHANMFKKMSVNELILFNLIPMYFSSGFIRKFEIRNDNIT